MQYYKKDGTVADIESTVGWLFDEDGLPVGLQGSSRDITERKRERESLLKTQFAMGQGPPTASSGSTTTDRSRTPTIRMLIVGFTREELLSMKVFDIDPDFPEDRWEQHKKEMRHPGSHDLRVASPEKDGRFFRRGEHQVFSGTTTDSWRVRSTAISRSAKRRREPCARRSSDTESSWTTARASSTPSRPTAP